MEKELPQEIKNQLLENILAQLHFNDLSEEEQWEILEREQE